MTKVENVTVTHNGVDCDLYKAEYGNGRPALQLVERETGEPWTRATVNLPAEDCPPGHAFVKDYSENAGVLAALLAAGVVADAGRVVPTGYAEVRLCRLLV